jgi:hypothetical protein
MMEIETEMTKTEDDEKFEDIFLMRTEHEIFHILKNDEGYCYRWNEEYKTCKTEREAFKGLLEEMIKRDERQFSIYCQISHLIDKL